MTVSLWVIAIPVLVVAYLYFVRRHFLSWQLALVSLIPAIWLVAAWRTGHLRGNWRAHSLRRLNASLGPAVDAKILPRHHLCTRRGEVTGIEIWSHTGWSHDQTIASVDKILAAYRLPTDVERTVTAHAHGHITVRLDALVPTPPAFEATVDQLRTWVSASTGLTLGLSAKGPVMWDPRKVPHLLVVGVTGSGKSVTGYSLVAQAILAEYQVVAVDPKRLDLAWLTAYGVQPAITPEQSAAAFAFTEAEMERRLDECKAAGVQNVRDLPTPPAPVLVVVEEAAELLETGNKPTKDSPGLPSWLSRADCLERITSLARLGRAADIHLLLLAQRPDASILTGQLRSQLSARVVVQDAGGPEAMRMVGLSADEAETFAASGPRPGRFVATFGSGWTVGQAPYVSMETLKSLR
jgi:hypothetical protein